METLLTAYEVAEIIGRHVNWVWAETKGQRIPHIRIGRSPRYRRSDIERWLEEQACRAA